MCSRPHVFSDYAQSYPPNQGYNITKTVFQRGYRLKAPRHALIQTDLVSQNTSANGEKGGHLGEEACVGLPQSCMHAFVPLWVSMRVCDCACVCWEVGWLWSFLS